MAAGRWVFSLHRSLPAPHSCRTLGTQRIRNEIIGGRGRNPGLRRSQDRLDGGAEFDRGVPGDRDTQVQFAGKVAVPQFEVEGVEEASLSLFRQPANVDIRLGDRVQQRKINRGSCLTLPGKLCEQIFLLPLFGEDCSESDLDTGSPRLVEFVVSRRLELFEFGDEVVLAPL